MDQKPMRRVADSAVTQTQIVLSSHINGAGRLFGGQLMEWIDIVAGVVARRHSHCNQTTASVDNLQFKEAVRLNDTLILLGKITYVGHTSMEVQVDSYVEDLDGTRKLVNTAFFVMVALDEKDHPVQVPGLILETEEEKAAWESGKRRNELRNAITYLKIRKLHRSNYCWNSIKYKTLKNEKLSSDRKLSDKRCA